MTVVVDGNTLSKVILYYIDGRRDFHVTSLYRIYTCFLIDKASIVASPRC